VLSTFPQTTNQYGPPLIFSFCVTRRIAVAVEPYISYFWGGINIISVGGGHILQILQQAIGDESPFFVSSLCVKSVEHPIICSNKDNFFSILIRIVKSFASIRTPIETLSSGLKKPGWLTNNDCIRMKYIPQYPISFFICIFIPVGVIGIMPTNKLNKIDFVFLRRQTY
jgi:hypothetical protein